MEKFLVLVPTVYEILREARERYKREELFAGFWKRCEEYLWKCGYRDYGFMCEGDLFHRQSFNFWRREFKDAEEGLGIMFAWFRSCFGIEGNDEYCIVNLHTEVTYDWNKMRACHEGLYALPPQYSGPIGNVFPPSKGSVDWSPETTLRLREAIERMKYVEPIDEEAAQKALEDIRAKNAERGYWQDQP